MTHQEEIAALQARLARARSERDTWQASGMQEKYLEAYSTVDALELALDRLRQEGLQASARNDNAVEHLDVYDGHRYDRLAHALDYYAPDAQTPEDKQRAQMAELAITFRDGMYHLGPYRYSRLADAVNYARLLRVQGREAA